MCQLECVTDNECAICVDDLLIIKKNKNKNTSEVMDGCHGINSVCIGSTSTSVQVVPQW